MRKLKLLAVLLALVGAMVILTASPAMASHDDDGWWDDCEWAWSPGWGWFVVCDVDEDTFWADDSDFWDDDDDCWEWSWVFEEWQWECDDDFWWERDRDHDWNWWDRDRDHDWNWWNRDWDDDDDDDGISFSIGDADNESGGINFS